MLSITIITKNEEQNIARCLKSIQWADEIIVVDAMSTDATVELCKKFNAKVVQRKWEGFAKQKMFALSQAKNEWVLSLDADEEITEELKIEIESILSSNTDIAGYEIPRKSFFLGKWMKHGGWYPVHQLRLFKKSVTTMNVRPVHEGFEVQGKIARLTNAFNHYTYHSLHQYLEKMNDYTSLEVVNKLSARPNKKIQWYNFLLNPSAVFVRMFFSLQGFRDGFHGFLLAMYSSLYTLLVYAKSWEYQIENPFGTAMKNNSAQPPITTEQLLSLKQLQ